MAVFRGKRISTKGDLNNKTAFVQVVLYNNVQSFYIGSPCSKIYVLQHPCQSAYYEKVSKKIRKNSHIYLDVMDKLSTFAPALLERQSLMIDILLMIKGSENKNKKTSKRVWMLSEKVLIFASAFVKKAVRRRPHQFFEILINNTSSTRKDRTVNTICYICSYICNRNRYQNEVNKLYGILNRAITGTCRLKDTFTMKSLILAQDERQLQA